MYTAKQTGKLLDSFHSNRFGFGHRGVAKFFNGNYNAAVFLDRLIYKLDYWTKRGELQEDGSFFYTVQDVLDDLHMSKRIQDGLIKKFKSLGLLEVSNRGVNNVRHFKLNIGRIHKFLADCSDPAKRKEKVESTENKKKPTKYKLYRPDKAFSSPTKPPISKPNSFNSSSQDIEIKEDEKKMDSFYQQELYEYCKKVIGMDRLQAKQTIKQCVDMGISEYSIDVLQEAYALFKQEMRLSGKIIAPHKYFANGIGIAMTNLRNKFKQDEIKVSDVAVPFHNWLE